MKLYRFTTTNNGKFNVKADGYTVRGGKYLFYVNGELIPDFFFKEDTVLGILVVSDNVEGDEKLRFWRRLKAEMEGALARCRS